MKYLKLFENTTSYEAYKASEDYVLPNVSYVENSDVVMYNPNTAQQLIFDASIYEDRKALYDLLSNNIDKASYTNDEGFESDYAVSIPEITIFNLWSGYDVTYSLCAYIPKQDMFVFHDPEHTQSFWRLGLHGESNEYMFNDINSD